MLVAPPNEPLEPFINVYMIIDPETNTSHVPRQLISFKSSNGNISTTEFGPQTLQNKMIKNTTAVVTPTSSVTSSSTHPPLRHLSAYNFFFRDERNRLLNGSEPDWSEEKAQRLLEEHWTQNRSKKRRHRKTHGKIDFTSLSKLISKKWKELPEHHKDFYRQVASRDFERFKRETNEPIMTTHASVVG